MNHPTLGAFILICMTSSYVMSQIYLECDLAPFDGCTCYDPQRPLVECNDLEITSLPVLNSSFSDIDTLDLSHNSIGKVEKGSFRNMTSLRRLSLADNKLTFHGLGYRPFGNSRNSLQWLDLSNNQLEMLPYPFRYEFAALRTLFLSDNKITSLGKYEFFHMHRLQELHLDGNIIGEISPRVWFGSSDHLSLVMLGVTEKVSVMDVPTVGLDSIEALSVYGASKAKLSEVFKVLADLPSIKHVELRNIGFMEEDESEITVYQHTAKQLKTLNLSNNSIPYIWPNLLYQFTKLQRLDLSQNEITQWGPEVKLPPYLMDLSLAENKIDYIDRAALMSNTDIKHIDLWSNRLTDIDWNVSDIDSFGHRFLLEIGDNPWSCSCKNKWLKDLVSRMGSFSRISSPSHLKEHEVLNTIHCGELSRTESIGKLVVDVSKDDFQCGENKKQEVRQGRDGLLALLLQRSEESRGI